MSIQKNEQGSSDNNIIILVSIMGLALLLFLVSSCAPPPTQDGLMNTGGSITNGNETEISTDIPLEVPEPSERTLTPVFTLYQLDLPNDLDVSGTIWVLNRDHVSENLINIINMDLTNSNYEIITHEEICKGMIPGRPIALCRKTLETKDYFMNFETGQSIKIPSVKEMVEDSYLDSHYFVAVSTISDDFVYRFIDYDSDNEYSFSQEAKYVSSLPKISYNGQFIATSQYFGPGDYRISLYDSGADTYTQISETNQQITGYYTWSPIDTIFLYGATNYVREMAGFSNQFYRFSWDEGESRLIKEAPDGAEFLDSIIFFSPSIWSPNGEYVSMALSNNQFCILGIYREYEQCYQISTNSVSWSPNSEYLAFYSDGDFEDTDPWIGILDIDKGLIYPIFESQHLGITPQLNWVQD